MYRVICYSLLTLILALPAFAGQTTIRETENEIIVEYTPDEEDLKANQVIKEQDKKKSEAEEASKQKLEEKHAKQRSRNRINSESVGDE